MLYQKQYWENSDWDTYYLDKGEIKIRQKKHFSSYNAEA